MNFLLLITVVSVMCSRSDAQMTYYISPYSTTNETCSDESGSGGVILRPCYSLQQLGNDNELIFHKSAITLFFLSGTHKLPKNYTLLLSDVKKVELSPWNKKQEELAIITILCHPQQTNIVFLNIQELNIFSLNFTSCTILSNSNETAFCFMTRLISYIH